LQSIAGFCNNNLRPFLPLAKPLERNVKRIGNYSYSSFLLPDLNPGQAFRLDEPIRLENSQITDTFPVTSKDGVTFDVTTSLTYGLPITISVAGEAISLRVVALTERTYLVSVREFAVDLRSPIPAIFSR
jgi:hypothetical protein